MGTRSLTTVYDYHGRPIIQMYRQYDGYFTGHGQDLADFLAEIKLVNGLSMGGAAVANGPECLAAQVVAHFKSEPGGIYLHAPEKDVSQEYNYHVYCESSDPDRYAPGPIRLVAEYSYSEREGPAFNGDPFDYDGERLEQDDDEDVVDYGEPGVDHDTLLREQALAKLSSAEKRVLGVE